MTYLFDKEQIIAVETPEDWAEALAHTARSMIRTARLALENCDSGFCTEEAKAHAVADTLEMAEALLSVTVDGAELMSRKLKCGAWGLSEGREDAR